MRSTKMSYKNEVDIDKRRLDKIKYEILKEEDNNAKTQRYSYTEMVEKVKRIIINAVDEKL